MDVDPITLEVMRNKLDGIANEMQLTLVRSAFSAIVKEGLDASASLFTLQGETLAQALAVPVHLGALTPMVGRLRDGFCGYTLTIFVPSARDSVMAQGITSITPGGSVTRMAVRTGITTRPAA